MQKTGKKIVARNKRARFDYELLEQFEAGMVLRGTEIKSIRANQVSLQRSFVRPLKDELWLIDANIAPYEHGNRENHEPTRARKLLLHRREINRIIDQLDEIFHNFYSRNPLTCLIIYPLQIKILS